MIWFVVMSTCKSKATDWCFTAPMHFGVRTLETHDFVLSVGRVGAIVGAVPC